MLRNQVRIIGGKWKARKIAFPDMAALRPSPDRVRETLFNWIHSMVFDSIGLDLFAGSGVLGFEALSRGAKRVIFVDQSSRVISTLQETQRQLGAENMEIHCAHAVDFLQTITIPFNFIFLDPPYYQGLLKPCLDQIHSRSLLAPKGFLYIEQERHECITMSYPNWNVVKEKRAGKVLFQLIQYFSA